jgi:hypothetical protein
MRLCPYEEEPSSEVRTNDENFGLGVAAAAAGGRGGGARRWRVVGEEEAAVPSATTCDGDDDAGSGVLTVSTPPSSRKSVAEALARMLLPAARNALSEDARRRWRCGSAADAVLLVAVSASVGALADDVAAAAAYEEDFARVVCKPERDLHRSGRNERCGRPVVAEESSECSCSLRGLKNDALC